jgi:anhydro-N-acetylmuramic acid kinase
MVYKVIGLMSGSSLDGLDIVYAEVHNEGSQWNAEIVEAACYPYTEEWVSKLRDAVNLDALHYQLLHAAYGHYLGKEVNRFIDEKGLHYKVALVASHGHTTFHLPLQKMTAQLGDGAAIASHTGGVVVSDLRALDVAFGGQGAPIVPIGEKLLFREYGMFLNLGGIANISIRDGDATVAFDICAANKVLNLLMNTVGKEFDEGGAIAATGSIDEGMLQALNSLPYYREAYPKSLANSFGIDEVYPLVSGFGLPLVDALRTYTEHIAVQVKNAVLAAPRQSDSGPAGTQKMLVTGGGAFNTFLVGRLQEYLEPLHIEVVIPSAAIIQYKEALIMALIGVLRWRQEYNVLSSVTGATRDTIGGAVWIGQEA